MTTFFRQLASRGQSHWQTGAFALPSTPLARTRLLFLVFCQLLTAASVPVIVFNGAPDDRLRVTAGFAVAFLFWHRARGYAQGRFSLAATLLDGLALLALGLGVDNVATVLGAYYGGVCVLSLYGSARRIACQVVVNSAAVALAATFGTTALAKDGQAVSLVAVQFLGFALMSSVLHMLATTLTKYEQVLAREHILTTVGITLVAAAEREQLHAAAVEGALLLLLTQSAGAHASLWVGSSNGLLAVAVRGDANGEGAEVGSQLNLSDVEVGIHAALQEHAVVDISGPHHSGVRQAFGIAFHDNAVLVPLRSQADVRGALALGTRDQLSADVRGILQSLGSVIALALDSRALAETLHQRRTEARFRALVQHASDLVTIIDGHGTIQYQSPSAERVLGYAPESLVGRPIADLLDPLDRQRVAELIGQAHTSSDGFATLDVRVLHGDGSWRDFETVLSDLLDDEDVRGVVLNSRDMTDRKSLEARLRQQAFHDPLTGMANRALFADRVEHSLAWVASTAATRVLLLDLDDFKTVNDSLGHAAGDLLLEGVAERLRTAVGPGDIIARLGGDEFAILVDRSSTESSDSLALRLFDALRDPFTLTGQEFFVNCSIGIAEGTRADVAADGLLRDADAAMYHAKRQGKGTYAHFEPDMHLAVLRRLALQADLRRAIDANEFVLYYQPIVVLATGEIVGFEALVRWQHPERGLLLPSEFISAAEESALILPIGRLVLRQACKDARDWPARGYQHCSPSVSVNISARQLQQPFFASEVAVVLAEAGLSPNRLVLETTETALLQDPNGVAKQLQTLRALGVQVAIDDFGTGYSSLSYLRELPIDVLKIDKSFVDGVGADPQAGALVRTILSLGEMLHLKIIAEGIEEFAQADQLGEWGCEFGQGYAFAKPMPASSVGHILAAPPRQEGARPSATEAAAA